MHFPTLFKPRDLIYNPDSFPLAYRINVAFKLINMAKLGGEMVVPIDCTLLTASSSTFTTQPDTLFKTLKGKMVTTLNQQHIPI